MLHAHGEVLDSVIVAQRRDHRKGLLWSRGGAAICIADDAQFPGGIVGDGARGVIVACCDNHQRLRRGLERSPSGSTATAPRSEPSSGSWPRTSTSPRTRAAGSRRESEAKELEIVQTRGRELTMYGVWREVAAAKDGVPTWESLGVVLARGDADYTFTAATFADSCAAGAAPSTFMVDYHLLAWGEAWDSAPVTGWSVDNLAPARPANLHLTADGRLAWDTAVEPDFRQFTVYGSSVGRLDDSATVVARTPNNGLDVGGLAFPYLLVTSGDIHDNESIASGTSALSGVEVSPVAGLPLHPRLLDPFNSRTPIAFLGCRRAVRMRAWTSTVPAASSSPVGRCGPSRRSPRGRCGTDGPTTAAKRPAARTSCCSRPGTASCAGR